MGKFFWFCLCCLLYAVSAMHIWKMLGAFTGVVNSCFICVTHSVIGLLFSFLFLFIPRTTAPMNLPASR